MQNPNLTNLGETLAKLTWLIVHTCILIGLSGNDDKNDDDDGNVHVVRDLKY